MGVILTLARCLEYCTAIAGYRQRLAALLGVSVGTINGFYREMEDSWWLKEITKKKGIRKGYFEMNMLSPLRAPLLYVFCRVAKPRQVVETGVAEGFSSSFILAALEKNGKGRLYSIDLPNQPGQELLGAASTGWLIPGQLSGRWHLTLGPSKEKLPPLLDELGSIDLFYHDSDHSYENMMFEFHAALPRLADGGFVVSDDITDNRAFGDFCAQTRCRYARFFKFGILQYRAP
ncbi:MAG: class I SAM-dependent methyltransferase [Candidatus Omnitrophica bacterium]|nr:class I SAM-dependent methyltransferase [Candidatus Omnitrophota bacterium]